MDADCVKEDTGDDGHAGSSPADAPEAEKEYGLDWSWDDEEDLRRFLKGGLAAK
jgi:hypothetical protein